MPGACPVRRLGTSIGASTAGHSISRPASLPIHEAEFDVRPLERTRHITAAKNARLNTFADYLSCLPVDKQQAPQLALIDIKAILLRFLSPRRISGLGGFVECQSCGSVAGTVGQIRHRTCLWHQLR